MRYRPFVALGRAFSFAAIAAILAVVPIGCGGDGGEKTAGTSAPPPQIQKANQSMQDFVNSKQQQKKK